MTVIDMKTRATIAEPPVHPELAALLRWVSKATRSERSKLDVVVDCLTVCKQYEQCITFARMRQAGVRGDAYPAVFDVASACAKRKKVDKVLAETLGVGKLRSTKKGRPSK